MRDPIAEFKNYNRAFARRNAELLRLKVERMAASPFAFFRGTFHLFARDTIDRFFDCGPERATGGAELDLVGDIHGENYGTFQADDGRVHYDINDFDETTQGRLDFDVRRATISAILAAQERQDSLEDATLSALAFLNAYTESVRRLLKKGAEYDVNEEKPSGCAAVDHLVRDMAATKRQTFIGKLTETKNGQRHLQRSLRYFNLPDQQRDQALRLLADYRQRMPEPSQPNFYDVQDVCGRVSGIGSMGRFRYVVMVNGKGNREARNVLLEFKEARPSAYDIYRQRETDAAALAKRAERVIAIQKESQAASNGRLGFAVDGGQSFQVRELGPHDERVDLKGLRSPADLRDVTRVQAAILARTHARAAARVVGVANPLAELNDVPAFTQRTLAFALAYADQAREDWKRFVGQRSELDHCEKWASEAE